MNSLFSSFVSFETSNGDKQDKVSQSKRTNMEIPERNSYIWMVAECFGMSVDRRSVNTYVYVTD